MKPSTPIEVEIVCSGQHLQLVRAGKWEFVQRRNCTGIVVLVAVTAEGKLLLVEQFRPPVGCAVVELPAGLAGDVQGHEDEQLATAARRELLEETGYEAAGMELLTAGPPSSGISDEVLTFLRATGLRRVGPGGGDRSEEIQVREVALDEVPAWLEQRRQAGALIDPKVYDGLYF